MYLLNSYVVLLFQDTTMENMLHMTFFLSLSLSLFCEAISQTPEKLIPENAAGINTDLATFMQKHHLQELFSRYGENDTLTIEGFRKLLRNMGIEKVNRIALDHEHHHSHHHHVTLSANTEKTDCPSDESGNGNKGLRDSQTKDSLKGENSEPHHVSVNSRSTPVAITASTFTAATEGNHMIQHLETPEPKSVHMGFASPNPSLVLESKNASLLVNGKANESLLSIRNSERGNYMYSKIRKQNTQEVRSY